MASNNRFARQTEQPNRNKNLGHNEQISVDAQLARLEEDIRRLKIEYDIFFNNGTRRAPTEFKGRVETMFKRLGDDRNLTFAQRYHYNSLTARYTAYKELWRRTLQGREEGRDAASVERAKHERAAKTKAEQNVPTSFSCADVRGETATVKSIFDALLTAKAQCGERTDELSFANFEQQLAAQTERFKKNTGCERVSFSVGVENGTVFFKAKADV